MGHLKLGGGGPHVGRGLDSTLLYYDKQQMIATMLNNVLDDNPINCEISVLQWFLTKCINSIRS